MTMNFAESKKDENKNILLVGLGGGGLAMYLRKCCGWLGNVNLDVVELDQAIVDVAEVTSYM